MFENLLKCTDFEGKCLIMFTQDLEDFRDNNINIQKNSQNFSTKNEINKV